MDYNEQITKSMFHNKLNTIIDIIFKEMNCMNIYILLVSLFMIILSIFFFRGKGLFLLGNWAALTKNERNKYDMKKVRRTGGCFTLIAGAATLGLSFKWEKYLISYTIFISLLIFTYMIYTHTKCLK